MTTVIPFDNKWVAARDNKWATVRDKVHVIHAINRFGYLKENELREKIKETKKQKFWRFFKKHKWRVTFIFITIAILIICFIYKIPINGDLDTSTKVRHMGSVFGYFTASIFACLLITVLGVETYFSREEMKELNDALDLQAHKKVEEVKEKLSFKCVLIILTKLVKQLKIENPELNTTINELTTDTQLPNLVSQEGIKTNKVRPETVLSETNEKMKKLMDAFLKLILSIPDPYEKDNIITEFTTLIEREGLDICKNSTNKFSTMI